MFEDQVTQTTSGHRRTSLEQAMDRVGDLAYLNHDGHRLDFVWCRAQSNLCATCEIASSP